MMDIIDIILEHVVYWRNQSALSAPYYRASHQRVSNANTKIVTATGVNRPQKKNTSLISSPLSSWKQDINECIRVWPSLYNYLKTWLRAVVQHSSVGRIPELRDHHIMMVETSPSCSQPKEPKAEAKAEAKVRKCFSNLGPQKSWCKSMQMGTQPIPEDFTAIL
jgi:hypothetical protein